MEETEYLLNILKDKKIVERLDERKVCNYDQFRDVFEGMQFGGFSRSVELINMRKIWGGGVADICFYKSY